LKAQEIEVMVNTAKSYFDAIVSTEVVVGVPYLVEPGQAPTQDYTGLIGISGPRKGCVYFSAPSIMLRHFVMAMGEPSSSSAILRDMIGEVANTIAGNARESFGSQFMISVPMVIEGKIDSVHLPKEQRACVIPLKFKSYTASLVVWLQ